MITLLEKAKKTVRFDVKDNDKYDIMPHIGTKFDFRASGEANILSKSVFICGKYDFFIIIIGPHFHIRNFSSIV